MWLITNWGLAEQGARESGGKGLTRDLRLITVVFESECEILFSTSTTVTMSQKLFLDCFLGVMRSLLWQENARTARSR